MTPFDWERAAKRLWNLLDDVDTAIDSTKPEPSPFREVVLRTVAERHEVLVSDGYKLEPAPRTCAACGRPAQGNASIHRDGFSVGPEVDLCNSCGMHELPTCEQLWEAIAKRRAVAAAKAGR